MEYRAACQVLLQELAIVLPSPLFPSAGILVDLLRIRVTSVLTSDKTGVMESKSSSTDPRTQLIVFYMEIMSRLTIMQRCIELNSRVQDTIACKYG